MGDPSFRHPDIELVDPPEFPDAGRHVGEDALRRSSWSGTRRAKASTGGPDRHDPGARCLFEEGKVRRMRQYLGRAAALEAVGLSE